MGNYSENFRKRVSTRGPKEGYCVICGEYGKLSRDHVPPKKCNNSKNYELKQLFQIETSSSRGVISQGGTHFKTLCYKCNSERLGLEYDPALIQLSNEITGLVTSSYKSTISLPESICPFVKPQRLARSIVGHVLAAAAVKEVNNGLISAPLPNALRKYFLDKNASLPDELSIFYWVFPSTKQIIIKGFGKSSLYSKEFFIGDLIKFLPLGFLLVWKKPSENPFSVKELVPDRDMGIDDMHQMHIDLKNIPKLDFPEATADHEVILLNSENTVSGNPM